MIVSPSTHAVSQYATTTTNLAARIAFHRYGTNPQDWFSWLDERLPLRGRVLDVGAGLGTLWSRIDHVARRLSVILTDLSPVMCRRLRTVRGAQVLQCDAGRLPLPDASFDTVVANHVLYHLDDPAVALREFNRVLRAGGRVAIATNGRDHLAELEAVWPLVGRPDLAKSARLNHFTAETGPTLVAAHFADVIVERYPCDLASPDPEPVLAYLTSMAAARPLTPGQLATARDFVQAQIDAYGSFYMSKHTVLITAAR